MIDPNMPPKKRAGYRWEYRSGCDCDHCKGKSCIGRTWPHWAEVKEPTTEAIRG